MAKAKKEVEEGLVRVEKDGEVLDVHHTCLEAHLALGFKVVQLEPKPE